MQTSLVVLDKNYHYTLFVYRLGQWVFSPLRGVRFSYRVPDLITLVINPVGDLCREIFLVTARLCWVTRKMETKSKDGYGGHAGTSWQVMWMTDKSMDGMVGQVQNCLFCQTPSVIKCGISLVLSRYRDLINHYSTVRVRLTLSDITATRSPEDAPLLANRHDNTKLISLEI